MSHCSRLTRTTSVPAAPRPSSPTPSFHRRPTMANWASMCVSPAMCGCVEPRSRTHVAVVVLLLTPLFPCPPSSPCFLCPRSLVAVLQTIPVHQRGVWDLCHAIVWDIVEDYLDSRKTARELAKETAQQRVQWRKRRDRLFQRAGEAEVCVWHRQHCSLHAKSSASCTGVVCRQRCCATVPHSEHVCVRVCAGCRC